MYEFVSGWWRDKDGNKVDLNIYRQDVANSMLQSLVNCKDCVNCANLTDCVGCTDCRDLVGSYKCKGVKPYSGVYIGLYKVTVKEVTIIAEDYDERPKQFDGVVDSGYDIARYNSHINSGWLTDSRSNKVDLSCFTFGEALYMLKSLVGCKRCSNCVDCVNCYDCVDCRDLQHCSDCSECKRGVSLRYCSSCLDCVNCYECEGLKGKQGFKDNRDKKSRRHLSKK